MLELSLMWSLTTAWISDRRRQLAQEPRDRGDILQTVVIIGLLVAIAVAALAVIAAKTMGAANKIQTQ